MRKQIAAANWKMNLDLHEGVQLVTDRLATSHEVKENQLVILAVPFPYLIPISNLLNRKQNVFVAAQNCSANDNGAFTGEVSARMLKSIGIEYVILGHSERREYHFESNSMLASKVNKVLEYGLKPVFCCGESLDIREQGSQNQYVETQLRESLFHLDSSQVRDFIIAYEPIWAIGTGKTASSDQAQEMHAHIRSVMAAQYGQDIADSISILYGGSVKSSNAKEIFVKPDVDGGLVGGASLVADEFASIINSLK